MPRFYQIQLHPFKEGVPLPSPISVEADKIDGGNTTGYTLWRDDKEVGYFTHVIAYWYYETP